VLEVVGPAASVNSFLKNFTKADLDKTDLGYRRTFWPGGRDSGSASPMPLFSGTALSIGTLALRKMPLYRAHVRVEKGACAPGERVSFLLERPELFTTANLEEVACDQGLLLTHLSPGDYRFIAFTTGQPVEKFRRGRVEFRIGDRNVEVIVPLSRGVDIEGSVVLTDNAAKPRYEAIQVHMRSRTSVPVGPERLMEEVTESGRFRFVNKELRDLDLVVQGVPETHYVKEIRYGGLVLKEPVVPVSATVSAQTLEIVLDDKPVTIGGTVREDGRPVPEAFIALAKSPFSFADVPYRLITTTGQSDGSFQFAGLAPGEYQVIAVPLAARYRLDEPPILGTLLNKATTVKLEPRGFQNVALDLLKP